MHIVFMDLFSIHNNGQMTMMFAHLMTRTLISDVLHVEIKKDKSLGSEHEEKLT